MSSRKYQRPRSRGSSNSKLFSVVEEENSKMLSPSGSSSSLASVSNASLGHPMSPPPRVDLKKEYIRFCKLYASEPLDIVAAPLEKASYGRDSIVVDLKGRGLRGVDCIALGKILALDAPISQILLSDCLLLPQGFQALIDGICKNSRLEVLELRGNNIQTVMTASLGKLLKTNHHLKKLLLEWNCLGISKESFHSFCEGLMVNSGLEVLDLRNNQLTAECAVDIANSLRTNKRLRELDLRWNSIGVTGAKAIWESLRFNMTLSKIHLCGNFIPEEVVNCIEHCIQQQSERERMMEEYSQRTALLTKQIQKTEKAHENEISNIVSVFDAEEAEYREAIRESHDQIQELDDKLRKESLRSHSLTLQVEKLRASLEVVSEKEETLRKALEIKEEHAEYMENLFKTEMEKLKSTHETKIQLLLEEMETKRKENRGLQDKIKRMETDFELESNTVNNSNEQIQMMKKELQENRKHYEERLKLEKEKWNDWKAEVETTEKREITTLQAEIKTIQTKMLEHIKAIEKGKADAEEEIRHLKISFVTQKTEGEEEMTRMRMKLKADFDQMVDKYDAQVTELKAKIDKLEAEHHTQNSMIRKLESENGTLLRQNENLRQQMNQMDLELVEKDSAIHSALARARTEVREQIDQLAKEEEANKTLRIQNLELQEQLATATLKQSREIQVKFSEMDHWKAQVERREEELTRLKGEDMRRAALLHEAFLAYMRSTAAATGLPLPPSYYSNNPDFPTSTNPNPTQSGDAPTLPYIPSENKAVNNSNP